ncbi:hypothetical protein AB1Y20_010459 [Prymnesium parvum]|uniref:Uncharacterized protein n=1 Tax=Prymnesium parvum TaxID=97485 RepID=A0AB34IQV4_PRYPA
MRNSLLPVLLASLSSTAGARGAALTRSRVLRGLCAVASFPAALELYARTPPTGELSALDLAVPHDAPLLCIVIPGSGGSDATSAALVHALRHRDAAVIEYSWSRFGSADPLRAPHIAQRVGRALGKALAAEESERGVRGPARLHVVGISAGAFVADALVASYKASTGGVPRAHVRLSLCDAFTACGLAGLARPTTAYGVQHFGEHADYCEAFFNTDDPVPSTSLPLRCAANYDVTSAVSKRSFTPAPGDSMHAWPAIWYANNVRAILRSEGDVLPYHGIGSAPARGSLRVVRN